MYKYKNTLGLLSALLLTSSHAIATSPDEVSGFINGGQYSFYESTPTSENTFQPFLSIIPDQSGAVFSEPNMFTGESSLFEIPRSVIYIGENIDISVRVPRALSPVWEGDADLHIVYMIPNGDQTYTPISGLIDLDRESDDIQKYRSIHLRAGREGARDGSVMNYIREMTRKHEGNNDILFALTAPDLDRPREMISTPYLSQFQAGYYQVSLVLTTPGGNPFNISEWYQGVNATISSTKFLLSDKSRGNDPHDLDGNGFFDDDFDRDGLFDGPNKIHQASSLFNSVQENTPNTGRSTNAAQDNMMQMLTDLY